MSLESETIDLAIYILSVCVCLFSGRFDQAYHTTCYNTEPCTRHKKFVTRYPLERRTRTIVAHHRYTLLTYEVWHAEFRENRILNDALTLRWLFYTMHSNNMLQKCDKYITRYIIVIRDDVVRRLQTTRCYAAAKSSSRTAYIQHRHVALRLPYSLPCWK